MNQHTALELEGEAQRRDSYRDGIEPPTWPVSGLVVHYAGAPPETRTTTPEAAPTAPARGLVALAGLSVPLWAALIAIYVIGTAMEWLGVVEWLRRTGVVR